MEEIKIKTVFIDQPVYIDITGFANFLNLSGGTMTKHLKDFFVNYTRKLAHIGPEKDVFCCEVDNFYYSTGDYQKYINLDMVNREAKVSNKFASDPRYANIFVLKIQDYEINDVEKLVIQKIEENEQKRKEFKSEND